MPGPNGNGRVPGADVNGPPGPNGDGTQNGFPSIADTFALFGDNKFNVPKEMLTGSTRAEELFARTEIDDTLRGVYLRIIANWDYWRDDNIDMSKIIALDANMLMSRDRKSRAEVERIAVGMARALGGRQAFGNRMGGRNQIDQ